MSDDVPHIELIDVDPVAFGPVDPPPPPAPPRQVPWKAVSVVAGIVVALGLAVAGLFMWKPWQPELTLRLADPRATTWDLSERLIFDPEPSDLRQSLLGTDPDAAESAWQSGSVGYFLAEDGATFDPTDGKDRWFGFTARPSSDPDTPMVLGTEQISGVPAEVSDETGGDLVQLAWGPLDGWTFNAAAAQMTKDEAMAIAEQLRIVDGKAVVLDRRALDRLAPRGPYGDFVTLRTLTAFAQNNGGAMSDVYAVYYGFDGQAVVSTPGNASVTDMGTFLFGDDAKPGTVHGQPAIGFTKGAGPFGGLDRSSVIWWEGGRAILVAGNGDLDATFRLAETVAPATDAQWAKVEGLD